MNSNRERREKGKESEVKRGERKKNKKIIYTVNSNCVCRDTIFNNPRMTLGSYVKDPNNMICKEWAGKGRTLGTGERCDLGFYRSSYMGGLGLTS